jgi:hypothetical protein
MDHRRVLHQEGSLVDRRREAIARIRVEVGTMVLSLADRILVAGTTVLSRVDRILGVEITVLSREGRILVAEIIVRNRDARILEAIGHPTVHRPVVRRSGEGHRRIVRRITSGGTIGIICAGIMRAILGTSIAPRVLAS